MQKTAIINLLILFLALMGGLGGAKDYKERLGPYEVSFTLPDGVASKIVMNKTVTSSEALDGTPYDSYILDLDISGADGIFGSFEVKHYNDSGKLDIDERIKIMEGLGKGYGYTSLSTHRIIDDHEGFIVHLFGSESEQYPQTYIFGYQIDKQTNIEVGLIDANWDTTMVPFLKSLHVEAV